MLKNRLLAMLLCFAMLLSLMPTALAADIPETTEAPELAEEPAPEVSEEPAPEVSEEPAPEVSEEPVPEEPAPEVSEEPAPEEPAPETPEEPAPVEPEEPEEPIETDEGDPDTFEGSIVASGECGDNATWTLDDAGLLTISGTGAIKNYSLSDTRWGGNELAVKQVVIEPGITAIGDCAFKTCKSLTSITIPEGVTRIGEFALYQCHSLTSITIPEGVTSIDYCAFADSNKLISITIPGSVTSIGEQAFDYCTGLTSVALLEGVTSIGKNAFRKCSSLTSVTIPGSVTSIGEKAFYECTSLTSVTIPGSVTSFGDFAFSDCTGLTSVTISEGMTSIGDYAFDNCSSLTSVTIPDSVTSIGTGAFFGCTSLPSITIPDSVTTIGMGAFAGCTSLPSITIPDSVTYLGEQAFASCSSLTSITLPDGMTAIGMGLLAGTGLTSFTIPDSVTSIGDAAFLQCPSLTSITIPDSVTSIGNAAFAGCTSLTSITIPDSVTSIGKQAFAECTSLTTITFRGDAPSIGDAVFENVTATAYYPSGNTSWSEVVTNSYGGNIVWVPVVMPGTPRFTGGNNDVAGITLEWDAASNATGYEVHRYNSSTGTYEYVASVADTTYTDTNVSDGNTYTYKVKTYCIDDADNCVYSPFSNEITAIRLTTTTGLTVVNTASGGLKLTWNAASGATGYDVYRYNESTDSYEYIESVADTTYTDTTATPGTTCYYKVMPFAELPSGDCWYGLLSDSGYTRYLQTPTMVSVINTGSGLKVTWNAVAGASGYDVYRYNSNTGTYMYINSTTSNSYNNMEVTEGENYEYKVKAYYKFSDGACVYSEISSNSAYARYLKTPTMVSATNTGSGLKVTWNAVTGATGYDVYRYNSSTGTYKYIKSTTGTTYTDTGITAGSTYYYKVKAYYKFSAGKYSYSEISPSSIYSRYLETPTMVSATNTGSGLKITWNAVSGATGYDVYRYNSSTGTYKYIKSTTSISYTDTGITAGSTYYYKVKAYYKFSNGKYAYSVISPSSIYSRYLETPTMVSATNTGSGLKVTWNAVSGATGYDVYRYNSSTGTYKYIKSTTSTSYTDTGITAGNTYYYKVKAYYKLSSGKYAYSVISPSSTYSRYLKTPVISSATSTGTGIKTTWGAVAGAGGYDVYRYNSSTGTYQYIKSTTSTYYIDTSVTAGKTYYYKVKAYYKLANGKYAYSVISAGKSGVR